MRDINLKEEKPPISASIPLRVYSPNNSNPDFFVFHHWHPELELIYIEKGEMIIDVDRKSAHVLEGNLYFINSEALHQIKNATRSISHTIIFPAEILSFELFDYCQCNYITPLLKNTLHFPDKISCDSEVGREITTELLNIINEYKLRNETWYFSVKISLYKIFYLLAKNNLLIIDSPTEKEDSDRIKLVKTVLQYIHDHFNHKLYIKDLAREVNMNEQYFCRFFKSTIGKTPIDYINQYRIEKAAELLASGNSKITDICFTVGFENFSYFIKKFKLYKGCTPKAFKVKTHLQEN